MTACVKAKRRENHRRWERPWLEYGGKQTLFLVTYMLVRKTWKCFNSRVEERGGCDTQCLVKVLQGTKSQKQTLLFRISPGVREEWQVQWKSGLFHSPISIAYTRMVIGLSKVWQPQGDTWCHQQHQHWHLSLPCHVAGTMLTYSMELAFIHSFTHWSFHGSKHRFLWNTVL